MANLFRCGAGAGAGNIVIPQIYIRMPLNKNGYHNLYLPKNTKTVKFDVSVTGGNNKHAMTYRILGTDSSGSQVTIKNLQLTTGTSTMDDYTKRGTIDETDVSNYTNVYISVFNTVNSSSSETSTVYLNNIEMSF